MSSPYLTAQPYYGMQSHGGYSRELSIFSQSGIAVFLIGLASGIPIQTLGKLYVGEPMLMALAPLVVLLVLGLKDQYGKTARLILGAITVSWLGYVGSDLFQDTEFRDFLRGWSKWLAIGASFSTLAWLGSKNVRYVMFFLVGLAVGSCMTPFIYHLPIGILFLWKFHIAVPIVIITLFVVSRFPAWVSVFALCGLSALSVVLDFRAGALMCAGAAGISFLAARRSAGRKFLMRQASRTSVIVSALMIAAALAVSVLLIRYMGERYGYTQRYQNSNATRFSSATVAWMAIKQSPILGHGSWPRDAELARIRDKLVEQYTGGPAQRSQEQHELIIAHSQILQGWLEGGIFGLAFFLVLGWLLMRSLLWQAFRSPFYNWTPLSSFIQIQCAWHLVFSPFSGAQRVLIPAACVFFCFIAEKREELKRLQHSMAPAYLMPRNWAAT